MITAQEVTGLNPVEVTNDNKGLQRCKPFLFLKYTHFYTDLTT